MLLKIATILGIFLTALGTILLWLGSPSGYALSGYGNPDLVQKVNKNNRVMNKKQRVAIALIVLGAMLQLPAVLCG